MANRTNLTTLRVISVFLVVLGAAATAAGRTIYVDADAGGSNDGSSWADAFNDLQDGLGAAWGGDEIRVAQGIYKPDEDSAHPDGTGYRTATFRLKNGVAVKGGYAGFGQPDPNARDIDVYETILSGDLLGNDGPDFANNYENSYCVVIGSRTNDTAVLDGFIITGGNASNSYNTGGGMYNNSGSPTVTNCTFSGNRSEGYGGGMYNRNESSPMVTNCRFSVNSTRWDGGGMFNESSSSPMVTNCTFADNSANSGGGMQNSNSSNPVLIDCTFTGNSVEWTYPEGGGGMHNNDSNPIVTNCTFSGNSGWRGGGMRNTNSSPTLTNCTFNDNSAEFGGGMVNSGSSPMVTNCTFIRNIASGRGGGMFNPGHGAPILINCILWGDSPQEVDGGPHVITYSDVQGGWPGAGNINANPLFVDPAISDYHLLAGSPCINSGDNSAVPPSVVTDLDGNPRIIGGTVDMGAYESSYQGFLLSAESVIVPEGGTATFTVMLAVDPLETVEVTVAVGSGDPDITVESGGLLTFDSSNYTQPQTVTLAAAEDADELHGATVILVSAPGVYPDGVTAYELDSEAATELYVDCDARGANNGLSWEDAFTELREGLSFAAGTFWVKEIRVAEGIYKPAPPSGPPLPPTAAPTGGSNSEGSEVTAGDREATFQLIDGVTIKGGYSGFGEPDPNARDIEVYETVLSGDLNGDDGLDFPNNSENSFHVVTGSGTDANAVLDGFIITGGNANGSHPYNRGGGMYNNSGSPTITNCRLSGNSASNGGGMHNEEDSDPDVTHCTFRGNEAEHGGGMCNSSSSPTLTNCSFSRNSAECGGGMYNNGYEGGCNPILINCVFSGNCTGDEDGGGMFNYNSNPTIDNCTFIDNSTDDDGGAIYSAHSSPTLTNCTFIGNSCFGSGGAISCRFESSPILTNCTFTANTADAGGAMHNIGATASLTNCIFTSNSATEEGGGLYNKTNSITTLTNCTFSGNLADIRGGGICNDINSTSTLDNCILWGNTAPSGAQIYKDGTSSVTVSYSDVQGGWAGEGNIDNDPCFVEPDYFGPISYWKFDEADGATAYDSAGIYDGTIYGAQWTTGQVDSALGFEGDSGVYVEASAGTDSPLNMYNTDVTISAWVKLNGPGGTIVARAKPGYITYRLLTWSATACISVYAPGHHYICSDVIINQDTWYHMVGVFDRASNKGYLYIDGIMEADGSLPDAPPGNNGLTKIGCRNAVYDYPFNGTIDEVMIFDRILAAEEIQQLYQIGLTGLGDCHLLPGSPCINAGDPDYVPEPNETDLDGLPRVIGGRIDMGAYEFNHIPVADAGPNQTVEAEGAWGAKVTLDGSNSSDADSTPGTNDDIVCFDWYKVDACDPNFEDFLGSGEIIDCNLPLGEHIIVLEVIDKADAFDTNEVTIIVQDTTPPVITLNGPATMALECRVDSYTEPGATATDICDGNVPVVIGGDVVDTSTCGTYVVTYDATDASGNAAEQVTRTVIVQDTIPPEFALSVTPTTLWPVSHKMVLITPTRTVSDICDESPDVSLVSITMNEEDEATGDGHTTNDIQVDDNGLIYLRAERSGAGGGRIYTITYQAVDDSGNVAVARATVTVPHDQR